MRIAICDDQQKDCEILKNYCMQYQSVFSIPIEILLFTNAGELLRSKKTKDADAILLDIYMDEASGMDAARILRKKGYKGAIIFTTISQEHYAQGYEVAATHYLLKPISWEAFTEALSRIPMKSLPSTIHVKSEGMDLEIAKNQIHYIEVSGHHTQLHTQTSTITIKESLSMIEKKLGGDPFLRCYRYFIINMDHVLRLKEEGFLMKDHQLIPISRDGAKEIRKRYLSYLFEKAEVNA